MNWSMSWESYLLPCLTLEILGIECPGCGLQRALVLAAQGQWKASFQMYLPWPLVLGQIVLLVAYALARFQWNPRFLMIFFIFTTVVVHLHYFYKVFHGN